MSRAVVCEWNMTVGDSLAVVFWTLLDTDCSFMKKSAIRRRQLFTGDLFVVLIISDHFTQVSLKASTDDDRNEMMENPTEYSIGWKESVVA